MFFAIEKLRLKRLCFQVLYLFHVHWVATVNTKVKQILRLKNHLKKKTGKNNVFGLKNQIDNRLEKSIIFVKPKLIT